VPTINRAGLKVATSDVSSGDSAELYDLIQQLNKPRGVAALQSVRSFCQSKHIIDKLVQDSDQSLTLQFEN